MSLHAAARRVLALLLCSFPLLAATASGSVPAPVVVPPRLTERTVLHAGATSPVDVAGTGLHRGDTIRPRRALVRWTVAFAGDTSAPVRIPAPKGWTLDGLGVDDPGTVGFTVVGRYHRTWVKVRLSADDAAAGGDHIYALVER